MANELTLNASLAYNDGVTAEELEVIALIKSVGVQVIHRLVQTFTTSESALNLGAIAAPGYVVMINLDPTNYVSLRIATGGTEAARLDAAGGFAMLKLGTGAQAPFLVANTANCRVSFLLCSA